MAFTGGPYTTSFFIILALCLTHAHGIPHNILLGIPESSNIMNVLSEHSSNGLPGDNSKTLPLLSSGGSDFQNMFSKNEDLMKYLVLLAAAPGRYDDQDQDVEDDSPAIDLVHGRKPENAWDEPIVLHQHRRQKKSFVIPELFLRDAAISSKTQPDPQFMRTFLARITSTRRLPRRASFEENDGHANYVSQSDLSIKNDDNNSADSI